MTRERSRMNAMCDAYAAVVREGAFPAVPEIADVPLITERVVDVMDREQFPELAAMRDHYASLSPERRAELDRDYL